MAFDGITTAAMAAELQEQLAGGYLSKIVQPEADALLLTIKTNDGQKKLFLSAQASLPLVYLTEESRQSPMTAPGFCMLLRKYIGGGRLLSVSQPGLERVLLFTIERRNEMGDLKKWQLVTEIMGKHSNIILTEEGGRIVDAIKRIPLSVSSVREVLPGREWFIPNTTDKKDPLTLAGADLAGTVRDRAQPLAKALYTSVTGFSPAAAEELCFRAGLDGGRSTDALTEADCERLGSVFQDLMEDLRAGHFSPVRIDRDGKPLDFSAIPMTMYRDLPQTTYDSVSMLIRTYYSEKGKITRVRQKSSDLRHVVQTALERTGRTLALQEKQMKDTEKRDRFRLYGELLNSYGYSIPAGADKAELLNYYTNEPVTIPLDRRLSAQENAVVYYNRYNKLKRTASSLQERLEETRSDREHLESVAASLELAANEQDLAQIRRELTDCGYIRAKGAAGSSKGKAKGSEKKAAPLCFRSSDGFLIYVGKNNYQNEEVSFGIASGNDWWFHAKKMPGSHVIVKTEGRDLPDRVFEEAARLAAYYSAGKLAPKVEIDYTLKKNLRRPPKARPGFVIYHTNYSMMASPDIRGIEQIL